MDVRLNVLAINITFAQEQYSWKLPKQSDFATVIQLDKQHRTFPSIFNWLVVKSSALRLLGVESITNFWHLLLPTWLHQIKISSLPNKQIYTHHITTGNNNQVENITIDTLLQ